MANRSVLLQNRLSLHYYLRIQTIVKMESNKYKSFYGSGKVREFITKVELQSSLKGYTGLKAAQNIASRLEGPAFDVYMRLPEDDKKDAEKIKQELLAEFEKGQLNREEAIQELAKRTRQSDESAQNFAYKVIELVKSAYHSIDDETRGTIANDYFVRWLCLSQFQLGTSPRATLGKIILSELIPAIRANFWSNSMPRGKK